MNINEIILQNKNKDFIYFQIQIYSIFSICHVKIENNNIYMFITSQIYPFKYLLKLFNLLQENLNNNLNNKNNLINLLQSFELHEENKGSGEYFIFSNELPFEINENNFTIPNININDII
ncbi:hypothetical protein ABK040_004934 [Willaertia magna]